MGRISWVEEEFLSQGKIQDFLFLVCKKYGATQENPESQNTDLLTSQVMIHRKYYNYEAHPSHALRKHAYSNTLKILQSKKGNFSDIKF